MRKDKKSACFFRLPRGLVNCRFPVSTHDALALRSSFKGFSGYWYNLILLSSNDLSFSISPNRSECYFLLWTYFARHPVALVLASLMGTCVWHWLQVFSCCKTTTKHNKTCLSFFSTRVPVRHLHRSLSIICGQHPKELPCTSSQTSAIQVVKKGTTGSGLIVMLELFQRSLSIVACAPKGLMYVLYRVIDLFVSSCVGLIQSDVLVFGVGSYLQKFYFKRCGSILLSIKIHLFSFVILGLVCRGVISWWSQMHHRRNNAPVAPSVAPCVLHNFSKPVQSAFFLVKCRDWSLAGYRRVQANIAP